VVAPTASAAGKRCLVPNITKSNAKYAKMNKEEWVEATKALSFFVYSDRIRFREKVKGVLAGVVLGTDRATIKATWSKMLSESYKFIRNVRGQDNKNKSMKFETLGSVRNKKIGYDCLAFVDESSHIFDALPMLKSIHATNVSTFRIISPGLFTVDIFQNVFFIFHLIVDSSLTSGFTATIIVTLPRQTLSALQAKLDPELSSNILAPLRVMHSALHVVYMQHIVKRNLSFMTY